jgi:regulator of sigma E protease
MLMSLLTVVVFLLMFTVLVAVHELGHYLVARKFNMGVSEFSIGMGRPILKTWMRRPYTTDNGEERETEFNIRAFPLGGFVKIVGMEPEEDGSESKEPGGFYKKSPWQRIAVLLAGPIFSLAFGWLILVLVFAISGMDRPNNVVEQVVKGEPAAIAGIQKGDRILEMDGRIIKDSQDGITYIRASNGNAINIKLERNMAIQELSVKPMLSAEERQTIDEDGFPTGEFKKQSQVGILFSFDHVYPGIGSSMLEAADFPVQQVRSMFKRITRPQVIINNSTGAVGMVAITNQAVRSGLSTVFLLTGMISLSLGIFNLLPIGPLDGGQIFLALIEILRGGKKVSTAIQTRFILVGIVLMGSLFIFRFYKDMYQYVLPGKENLISGPKKADPTPDTNSPAGNSPSANVPVK